MGTVSPSSSLEGAGSTFSVAAGMTETVGVRVMMTYFFYVGGAAAETAGAFPSAPARPPEPAAFAACDFPLAGADAFMQFGASFVFVCPVFVSVDFPLLSEVGREGFR